MFSWRRASFDVEHVHVHVRVRVRVRDDSMHLLRLNPATRDACTADRAMRFLGDFRLIKRMPRLLAERRSASGSVIFGSWEPAGSTV